jgi:hypothetical protein
MTMLNVFNASLMRIMPKYTTTLEIALGLLKMYLNGQTAKKIDGGIMAKTLNGVCM